MPTTCPLSELAARERLAATDTVGLRLPPTARVSVYLYQPVSVAGLRSDSPGVLWDVGPLPPSVFNVQRELLYQCAEAGRTGSFLQSAQECTRRVPQTSCIDAAAFKSYRVRNANDNARRTQIAVEQARHGFRSRANDGPPQGAFIHHLALAPSVQSFSSLSSGRLPVLGTIFTVTSEEVPIEVHEYSNLVDYAIFLAGELLEIRMEHLLGQGLINSVFEGSALEALLESPSSDTAVQLIVKLIFAHHWFFPYDAIAWALLVDGVGDVNEVAALYAAHGWEPPRRSGTLSRSATEAREVLVEDIATLIGHSCWYRLGREFRPRPGLLADNVRAGVNTALALLAGVRSEITSLGQRRPGARKTERLVFLAPPRALGIDGADEPLVAPVFSSTALQQLHRTETLRDAMHANRFDISFAACGPGTTDGHTRTHLKPVRFIDGFDPGGAPRYSVRTQDALRERTRWICSYAIGRLTGANAGVTS